MSPLDLIRQIVFSDQHVHVPMTLESIPQARVLFQPDIHTSQDERSANGWRIAASAREGNAATGRIAAIADRYGGAGIGRNGGSGRNAIVGDLQIKGVGRTPLVSPDTPLSHASGGAYLEECVREAIFSGIVAHDFPYGALPVLEIIDTGESQAWPAPIQPAIERRVLLVRPICVRPAHFERAVAFDATGHREAKRDHARVRSILTRASSATGPEALVDIFDGFWPKWAHQLAYGFVHRLSHGNDTSSNIALDGRLLDFGAASTLPSWACTASSYFHDPIATRFNVIAMAIRSIYYYLGRYLGWDAVRPERMAAAIARAAESFRQALVFEALRLSGLPDSMAREITFGPRAASARSAVRFAIEEAQRVRLDLLEPVSMIGVAWPMSSLWKRSVPTSVRRLRTLLNSVVGKGLRDDCEALHRQRTRTRSALFKPHLRAAFFEAIEARGVRHGGADPSFVREFIETRIQHGRIETLPSALDQGRLMDGPVPVASTRFASGSPPPARHPRR